MPSYRFGPYRLDTDERVLTRTGRPVALTRRMYETLAALVGRAGRVVEKTDLMREVWADAFVEEGNLTQVVFRLRKVLGGGVTKYIETVPRRGYRFSAAVREERVEAGAPPTLASADADVYPVAVLPLANASKSPAPEEIADGIVEALISTLSRRPRLRVMAASTVFRYKAREIDPLEVGRQLGVRAVVVGRVTHARDQLVVTAELVEVSSGALLWGGRCARRADPGVEAQDEITAELADRVGGALGAGNGAEGREYATPESREARRLYLSGRHHWNKRLGGDLKKALSLFRRALDEDPSYAPAYAGIADCYDTLTGVGELAPEEGYPKAKAAARRALEFDDALAEAHASLGHVHMRYDWDWAAAEREYLRAIELNPSYATARHWLSILLTIAGRHEEAIAEGERARRLDPLSPIINLYQGAHLHFARRYRDSLAHCQRILEADPDFVLAHTFGGSALSYCGRHEEAVASALIAHRLTGGSAATLAVLSFLYARAGREEEARAALAELAERAANEYVNPFEVAMIHAALGDERAALDGLERAYSERVGDLIFLRVTPYFDSLRYHPRFRRLLARLNLPKPLHAGRRLSAVS